MAVRPRPQTTPAPNAALIFMPGTSPAPGTSAPPPPEPTTAPPAPAPDATANGNGNGKDNEKGKDDSDAATGTAAPSPFPQPKLRLEIRDLRHRGTASFLAAVNASEAMQTAVTDVQRHLYGLASQPSVPDPAAHPTPTRSITLVLRDMPGVAYTTGTELDSEHKEIHFSTSYIAGVTPASRVAHEIAGVLTHEMVHCHQWDARGTCPGGLVEGVADWVRLRCGLAPPHWRREPARQTRWDAGYQHTAYFLDYLEGRFGEGTVRRVNEALRLHRYDEEAFWTGLLGAPVGQLWQEYVEAVAKEDAGEAKTPGEGTRTQA